MNNAIAVSNKKLLSETKECKRKVGLCDRLKSNASLILIAIMFILGSIMALLFHIPIKSVMKNYSYDVIVLVVIMELFTYLVSETGIMQFLAIKIAELSKGRKRICLMLFGSLMFLISSCLNNVTAVLMILPIVFVLFRALEVNQKYISVFFAVILALSNTGGASTGIGDLPAIILLSSGVCDFFSYTIHAFPLFAFTSGILLIVWGFGVKKENDDEAVRNLAISNLKSQYKNIKIRFDVVKYLVFIFGCMFIAWSLIPQNIIPPEIIAVLGYVVAMVMCSVKKIKIEQLMDLKSLLTIASFLFISQVVNQTGILSIIAEYFQTNISNPKLLVMVFMVLTSLVSGVFSAGPAAAAMLPVIVDICNGPLAAQSDWVAVAYAAAICSGSSLFMWSASAGFILSGKINSAGIEESGGKKISWGVGSYLKYGLINYSIQLSIALVVIAIVL